MEWKKHLHSKLAFSTVVIVAVFIFAFLSTIVLLRWNSKEMVGIVSSIESDLITITAPHGEVHTIHLNQDTKVYKGKIKNADISVGDMVLVVYTASSNGEDTASMVRVMNPPKKDPPPDTQSSDR